MASATCRQAGMNGVHILIIRPIGVIGHFRVFHVPEYPVVIPGAKTGITRFTNTQYIQAEILIPDIQIQAVLSADTVADDPLVTLVNDLISVDRKRPRLNSSH